MKLRAVKEGRYGFELTASVYPSLEPKGGSFVYLESLYFNGGCKEPLFHIKLYRGGYTVEFLRDIKGYGERINEFEDLFFGTQGYLISLFEESCVCTLSERASVYLYSVLCHICNSSRIDATAYAVAGKDGQQYPIKITLDTESTQVS